jgi:drug/metabolite transporter (DMT)-like permease
MSVTASAEPEPIMKAVIAIVLTALFFAISDVYAQVLTQSLPPLQVAFLRWLMFALFLPIWLRGRLRTALVTDRIGLHLVRGLLGTGSAVAFILGIQSLSIGDATGIGFCSPIITMALSVWFLKEHVGLRRWLIASVSLMGVFIIVQPGTSAFQWASILPLMAAILSSLMVLTTRFLKAENPDTLLFYACFPGLLLLGAIMPFVWVAPSLDLLWPTLVSGGFGALANVTMIRAYQGAAASRVAPFNYIQLPIAGLLGFLVVGTVPSTLALAGMLLIALSGAANAWLENRDKA